MIYDFDACSEKEYKQEDTEIETEQELPTITPPTAEKDDDNKPIFKEESDEKFEKHNNNGKIEIDIKSVNDLTSSLEFSAQKFNEVISKIQKNNDLMHILELLNHIKTNQFENFKNIEKNINLDNVEKIIEDKILTSVSKLDSKIKANVKVLETKTKTATDRYKKYAEAFEDPDVIDQLENIGKIEKSFSSFKFRNIVFSSIITAIITATVTFAGLKSYYQIKVDNAVQKNMDEKEKIAYLLSKKHIQIFDGNNVQLIFSKKENVEYFTANDGRKVLQFDK